MCHLHLRACSQAYCLSNLRSRRFCTDSKNLSIAQCIAADGAGITSRGRLLEPGVPTSADGHGVLGAPLLRAQHVPTGCLHQSTETAFLGPSCSLLMPSAWARVVPVSLLVSRQYMPVEHRAQPLLSTIHISADMFTFLFLPATLRGTHLYDIEMVTLDAAEARVMAPTQLIECMQAHPPEHLRHGKPQWSSSGHMKHSSPSPQARTLPQTRAWLPERPTRHSSQSSSPLGHHSANGRPQVGLYTACVPL